MATLFLRRVGITLPACGVLSLHCRSHTNLETVMLAPRVGIGPAESVCGGHFYLGSKMLTVGSVPQKKTKYPPA